MAASVSEFVSPLRAPVLKPGDRVTLHGLKAREDLNGATGKLLSFSDERWRVECEGGECIRIKAANLRRDVALEKQAEADAAAAAAAQKALERAAELERRKAKGSPEKIVDLDAEANSDDDEPRKPATEQARTWDTPEARLAWAHRTLMTEVDRGGHEQVAAILRQDDPDAESRGQMVVASGAVDVNHQDPHSWGGRSPLIQAAAKGHRRVVEALLKHGGANPDLQDDEGMTALMHAVKRGDAAPATMLIDSGAKLELEDLVTPYTCRLSSRHPCAALRRWFVHRSPRRTLRCHTLIYFRALPCRAARRRSSSRRWRGTPLRSSRS